MTDPDPDLDDWLAALAGRGGHLGPGPAEAAAIRAVVLAGPAEPLASAAATETTAPAGPAGDRGLVALMERLRNEGLLEGADPRDGSLPNDTACAPETRDAADCREDQAPPSRRARSFPRSAWERILGRSASRLPRAPFLGRGEHADHDRWGEEQALNNQSVTVPPGVGAPPSPQPVANACPVSRSRPPPADRSIRRLICPARLAWAGSFALAAGLALMVVVSALLEEPPAPPLVAQQSADFDAAPRLRTGPGPQPAGTATAAQLARLIERLKAEGLPYRLRAVRTGWRLDFYVPDESRAAASFWLNAESIAIPPTGWIRLETAKPPA